MYATQGQDTRTRQPWTPFQLRKGFAHLLVDYSWYMAFILVIFAVRHDLCPLGKQSLWAVASCTLQWFREYSGRNGHDGSLNAFGTVYGLFRDGFYYCECSPLHICDWAYGVETEYRPDDILACSDPPSVLSFSRPLCITALPLTGDVCAGIPAHRYSATVISGNPQSARKLGSDSSSTFEHKACSPIKSEFRWSDVSLKRFSHSQFQGPNGGPRDIEMHDRFQDCAAAWTGELLDDGKAWSFTRYALLQVLPVIILCMSRHL